MQELSAGEIHASGNSIQDLPIWCTQQLFQVWTPLDSSHSFRHTHTILGATAPTMGLSIDVTPAQHNYTKVGWVNEPDGRGTLSILVSCLSSLFLSSWAVMHLNVPRRRSSTTRRLGTYLYWCIYGIFGPELVIWTAWRQLLSAWALRNELRKVRTGMSCTDRAVADFL